MDPALDRALNLKLEIEDTAPLRIHAQEVRAFARNSLCLAAHAGAFREWRFMFNRSSALEMSYSPPKFSDLGTFPVEAEDSDLADLLRKLYYSFRAGPDPEEVSGGPVDARLSGARSNLALRGKVEKDTNIYNLFEKIKEMKPRKMTGFQSRWVNWDGVSEVDHSDGLFSVSGKFAQILQHPAAILHLLHDEGTIPQKLLNEAQVASPVFSDSSRSARVAARTEGRSAASGSGRGALTTRETRHLTPRGSGCRAPPMSMGDATVFWLHTMGLRDGLDGDDKGALDPQRHQGRVDALMGVRPEDLQMVMAALLRMLAMVVVETSSLLMMRLPPSPPPQGDDEVEVEVEEDGDDDCWMQTGAPRKKQRTGEEELAADEQEAMDERRAQAEQRERQQEAREQEEAEQARQDELLWLQHAASAYRDWEQWTVANHVQSPPRRLRAVIRLGHGVAAQQVACSVPLARGRPVELVVGLSEVAGDAVVGDEPSVCPVPPAPALPGPTPGEEDRHVHGSPPDAEARHVQGYTEWRAGRLSDEQVEQQFGSEMAAMFRAQQLVELDGENEGMADVTEQREE